MSRVSPGFGDRDPGRDPLGGLPTGRPFTAAERQRLGPEGVKQEIEDRLQIQAQFLDGVQAQLIATATDCLEDVAGVLGGSERCINEAVLRLGDSIRLVQRRLNLPIEQQAIARLGELREFLQLLPEPSVHPLSRAGQIAAGRELFRVDGPESGPPSRPPPPGFKFEFPEQDSPEFLVVDTSPAPFVPLTDTFESLPFYGGETKPPDCLRNDVKWGTVIGGQPLDQGLTGFVPTVGRGSPVQGYVRWFCTKPKTLGKVTQWKSGVLWQPFDERGRNVTQRMWDVKLQIMDYAAEKLSNLDGFGPIKKFVADFFEEFPQIADEMVLEMKQTAHSDLVGPNSFFEYRLKPYAFEEETESFRPFDEEDEETGPCPDTEDCFKLVPCSEETKECEPCPDECPSECPEDEDQTCLWVNEDTKECTIRPINTESPGRGWELLFCSVDSKQVEGVSDLICDTEGTEFCLWLKVEEQRCLILPQGENPESSGWELMGCSRDLKELRRQEAELCGVELPEPKPEPFSFNFPRSFDACSSEDFSSIAA